MNQAELSEALRATREYYETHAEEFEARTRERDMSGFYDAFLPHIPPGGQILDAGCGPGRDSAAFLARGYRVTAFDASQAMVRLAAQRIGQPVLQMSFEDVAFEQEFDGAWAFASLLHLPGEGLPDALGRLRRALKPGGVLYASFKASAAEEFRESRLFTDRDELSLGRLLERAGFAVERLWTTREVHPTREVHWTSGVARR